MCIFRNIYIYIHIYIYFQHFKAQFVYNMPPIDASAEKGSAVFPHNLFLCFVCHSEEGANFSLSSTYRSVLKRLLSWFTLSWYCLDECQASVLNVRPVTLNNFIRMYLTTSEITMFSLLQQLDGITRLPFKTL
jgi:hypothetical protein